MRKSIALKSAVLLVACSATAAVAQRPIRPPLPVGTDPNDWGSYFDRGVALLSQDGAAADEMFRWASQLDPSRPEPLYGHWVAFHVRDSHRFEQYLRDDARVLRDPQVLAADSLLLRALVRNPFVHRGLVALAYQQLPGDWGEDTYTRAFLAYAQGNLEVAARDLGALVRRSPGNFRMRHDLALTLVHLRRYDSARVELDSVLAALRRRDERRVARVYESKELLLYSIALLYLVQNRHDQAREAFAQAVLEDASQWYVHRGLGLALVAGGHPDDALAEYRSALELGGDDPLVLSEYAQALYAAGQYPAAVEQLTTLVRVAPDWAQGWLSLGNANVRAGHSDAAAEAFTAYLARAPRSESEQAGRVRASLAQLRPSVAPD